VTAFSARRGTHSSTKTLAVLSVRVIAAGQVMESTCQPFDDQR
jgi:hypothetical protein